MRSYQFIADLFKNVLRKSKAIGGRFHISAKGGLEINTDQLGEVLAEVPMAEVTLKKYPLALMMPPRSVGNYTDRSGEWETYQVTIFFLTTSYYNGANQVKAMNLNTQTSTHTVPQDWHDMKRCAVSFLQVLARVEKEKSLIAEIFRLAQQDKVINPVSFIGVDRAAGVRLDFTCSLFLGCTLEDYNQEDISTIIVPAEDSHPEHKM
jgi:hypothetical protein